MTAAVGDGRALVEPSVPGSNRRFYIALGAITAVGALVRFLYAVVYRGHEGVWGDPFFYHYGAMLLLQGKGFIAPLQYFFMPGHPHVQAADHPPLYLLFLSIPHALGIGTVLVDRAWSSVLGTATVFLAGLLGRRVAGARAGLIAAGIVALNPNVWVYDGQLLSETMAIFVVTLTLLLAYRAWDRPTMRRIVALGVACGFAALARSELALLVPAIAWPVAMLGHDVPRVTRVKRAGAATLAALVVVAPWVGYNISRFRHPVFLSSQLEATLAGANCDDTYRGPALGLITSTCMYGTNAGIDQSVTAAMLRPRVRHFIRTHLSRVPVVVAARVGRVTGLYHPAQQLDVDVVLEGREHSTALAALLSAYGIELAAVGGVIALRRRREPVFLLVVPPALVVLTVAATYGTNRFRASGETALSVLAAVAIDALLRRRADDSSGSAPDSENARADVVSVQSA